MILGRLIVAIFSFSLIAFGLWLCDVTPPASGGNFFGAFLVGVGGLTLVRMFQVWRGDALRNDNVLTYHDANGTERIG